MFALTRTKKFSIAACAALALFATGWPALADEVTSKSIGPNQPVMTNVGPKRVLAFYVPENGGCAVSAVVWDIDANTGMSTYTSSRVRMELNPGQSMKLDTSGSESLGLKCGAGASTLTLSN
jgi:hypothetical protein